MRERVVEASAAREPAPDRAAPAPPVRDAHPLLGLQRSLGNRYVERLVTQHGADLEGAEPSESPVDDDVEPVVVRRQPQMGTGARVAIGAGAGALAGAGIGALIGSFVPVIGTAVGAGVGAGIGALVGAIAGYFAGLRVGIPRIRAASTPAQMGPDRIPPRVNTPIAVSVAGIDAAAPDVVLAVDNQSAANGTVTINGAAAHNLRASQTVNLLGTAQTTRNNAGNLELVARQGGRVVARSRGFSVAAVPQNWSVAFNNYIDTAAKAGILVTNTWQSDSGVIADLDEVERSERVQPPSNNSGYRPGTTGGGSINDRHTVPKANLDPPRTWSRQQTFMFRDHRTGAEGIPARNSGFRLTRTTSVGGAGPLGRRLTISKLPQAGTAQGIYSDAGAGGANPGPQDL